MRRALLAVLILSPILLLGASKIDKQITQTSKQIKSFDKKHNTLNSRLAKTARSILTQKRTILRQQKRLKKLLLDLKIKEESFQNNQSELQSLQSQQTTLSSEQDAIEQKLVFALARNVSLSMLINDQRTINAEALITEEVLKQMTQQVQRNIKGLNQEYKDYTQRISSLELRMLTLQASINAIEKKRDEALRVQKSNKTALKKLNKDKKRYLASIENLQDKQSALKKTLSKLNIIRSEEVRKAEARKAKKQTTPNRARPTLANKNIPKVKQRGSSYQKIKTKRYRGKKTISPIDSYKLVKKFGPYLDPIYNIKIFNESVSLQPKRANAKVKNVLNGKVILAQNTSLLDNIVIVEHANGIHTIYAHMDQIAPTIKKGKKIRKGSVIGRVNSELMFEVTQKKYHIDPMQLIN